MKEHKNIQDIFLRYISNEYSQEDVDILTHFFGIEEDSKDLQKIIENELQKQPAESVDWRRVDHIKKRVGKQLSLQVKTRYDYGFILKIASLILVIGAVSFLLFKYNFFDFRNPDKVAQLDIQNDIAPGGNKATLTFSGGKALVLDEDKQGIDASSEDLRYNGGEVIGSIDKEALHATLVTPRGGQYQITLPDGSRVWLNASSSLKYPKHFDRDSREVELTGEGYFEVTSNPSKPFIVKSKGQQVVALGTAFNINAYEDEPWMCSTLVEGSIRMVVEGKTETRILKPNEQAVLKDGEMQVVQVESQVYTTWRNGQISLNQSDLASIIRQIERWYDVEFDMDYMPPTEQVFGVLKRNVLLSELLDALELHYHVKFKREGRRIRMTR